MDHSGGEKTQVKSKRKANPPVLSCSFFRIAGMVHQRRVQGHGLAAFRMWSDVVDRETTPGEFLPTVRAAMVFAEIPDYAALFAAENPVFVFPLELGFQKFTQRLLTLLAVLGGRRPSKISHYSMSCTLNDSVPWLGARQSCMSVWPS
jgi:hypothetical protein